MIGAHVKARLGRALDRLHGVPVRIQLRQAAALDHASGLRDAPADRRETPLELGRCALQRIARTYLKKACKVYCREQQVAELEPRLGHAAGVEGAANLGQFFLQLAERSACVRPVEAERHRLPLNARRMLQRIGGRTGARQFIIFYILVSRQKDTLLHSAHTNSFSARQEVAPKHTARNPASNSADARAPSSPAQGENPTVSHCVNSEYSI